MTKDNTSTDEQQLREKILTEFKQVHRLAGQGDYTENCTNIVMSLVTSYTKQRELALLDELIEAEKECYKIYGDDDKLAVGIKLMADRVRENL